MVAWIEPEAVDVDDRLLALTGGSRLVAEVLSRRGINDPEVARGFLYPEFYRESSPYDLPDMAVAVERLLLARARAERVGVWGDFDVDGQTATTLLVTCFEGLGIPTAYYIPQRVGEGHGITIDALERFIGAHSLSLIVTCDTGIAEHAAISYARERGVDVIVTDHHQLPPQLPEALGCVNPQRLPSDHPAFTLPGVGCAYKLAVALYERAGVPPQNDVWLDLVALGIVADVAVQRGDARYLLQLGLQHLRETKRLGLQMLMANAELTPTEVDAEAIAFGLAPRLNALGRMSDANMAVELLSTQDAVQARILADRVEVYNRDRKQLSDQVYAAALAMIEREPGLLDDAGLVLAGADWPGGVLGIAANRLAEAYLRPVILLSVDSEGVARGSARSVVGCNITEIIGSYSQKLLSYGGHTMAAGLSLRVEDIPALRSVLSARIVESLRGKRAAGALVLDGYVPLKALGYGLAEELELLGPFGEGNPPVTLATARVQVIRTRTIGRGSEHLRFTVEDEAGDQAEIIWWRWRGQALPSGRFDLAYRLRSGQYKGERELQIVFTAMRTNEEQGSGTSPTLVRRLHDFRLSDDPVGMLRAFVADHQAAVIWNEGEPINGHESVRRDQIQGQGEALVIWRAPPDLETLREVAGSENWDDVAIFAQPASYEGFESFVNRLAQLVKFRLNRREGRVNLRELAGLTGHRVASVVKGLEWLAARGDIRIISTGADDAAGDTVLGLGERQHAPSLAVIEGQLKALLNETAAFRRQFRQIDLDWLKEKD